MDTGGSMSLRFRIYRFLRKSRGSLTRYMLVNAIVFAFFYALPIVMSIFLEHDMTRRGGMQAWYGFLLAFSSILTLNTIIELMGTGYEKEPRRGSN